MVSILQLLVLRPRLLGLPALPLGQREVGVGAGAQLAAQDILHFLSPGSCGQQVWGLRIGEEEKGQPLPTLTSQPVGSAWMKGLGGQATGWLASPSTLTH